jgi:spectinomycin phosphotransferase
MLEAPDIPHAKIVSCLRDKYGLDVAQLTFLPLGADRNTAVYRAITDNAAAYFVKLRSGTFNEMTITVPRLLYDQGITQVIPPLPTVTQQLWINLTDFKLAVFPFVDGRNAYETDMLDKHWIEFGRALKAIHTAELSPTITEPIQYETFSDEWRACVRRFMEAVVERTFDDPISARFASFLKAKSDVINKLVQRAEELAAVLQAHSQQFVLCHADIHAGNILIDSDDGFHIVDWDTLILAPKERDLMYVGGGQFLNKRSPEEEELLFYRGYGPTQADPVALAYYRYERIVQDIAAYCEQILLTHGKSKDRENGMRQLISQFGPDDVVAMAYRSEQYLPQQYASESGI